MARNVSRVLSPNEKLLIDSVPIPDYFNRFIIANKRLKEPNRRFTLLQKGSSSAICPFHVDGDPSFHYWDNSKSFYCFGCRVAGDVIKLHQLWVKEFQSRSIDRAQAMVELAALYELTLEQDEAGAVLPTVTPSDRVRALLDPASYSGKSPVAAIPSAQGSAGMPVSEFIRVHSQLIDAVKRQPNLPAQAVAARYYGLDLKLSESLIQK